MWGASSTSNHQHNGPATQTACASCGTTQDATNNNSDNPSTRLVSSLSCPHRLCRPCVWKLHGQTQQESQQRSVVALPWMDCGVCRKPYAFHADMTAETHVGSEPSQAQTISYQWGARPMQPYAANETAYATHPAPPYYPYQQHRHHMTTYPQGAPSAATAVIVSPHSVGGPNPMGYPPRHMPHTAVAWQAVPQSSSAVPYHNAWRTRDCPPSPIPLQQVSPMSQVATELSPSINSGLVPPDIAPISMEAHNDLGLTGACRQVSTTSPSDTARKRSRPTVTAKRSVRTAMPLHRSDTSSLPNHKPWLTCRVCGQAVAVACQKLVSGPSPDDERLWPQVRLGKRLAASLRQHNQLHHPDWFMWNVKGRASLLTQLTAGDDSLDDAEAVAQVALGKALESAFEHLPHVAGVDTYDSVDVFQRRLLRRLGFAHAYLSYTSSEWTKWQQWKKERYTRTQIQAMARRLLERYESTLLSTIEIEWWRLTTMSHQEQLDVFQNLFVVPQCIRAGLEEGILLLGYDGGR